MAQRPGGGGGGPMMGVMGVMARSAEEGIATNVKAVLRVRPCLPGVEEQAASVIRIDGHSAEISNPRNPSESLVFKFDGCYGPGSGQEAIFRENLAPLIERVLAGYNGTVFAYGNTGAGKTFTMQGSPADPGMIPLAVAELLAKLSQRQSRSQTRWTLGVSYLEIYKERVYDLLSATPGGADLAIREDQLRNILVPGLTEKAVRSISEFSAVFEAGLRNRSTAATKLNSQSSRSHACLVLAVEQRPPVGLPVRAKLSLIDLAGSEDNRRTDNTGQRLAESGAINSSLFVLGQVVDALNRGNGARIPYRDSKLTRLLQDSLGGRAHALLITNVAPTQAFLADTHNSLGFAAKSRLVQNRVVETARIEEEKENLRRERQLNEWKQQKQERKKELIKRKPAKRKRESESEFDGGTEDSIYEVSEMDPPSSAAQPKRSLPTPPVTKSNDRVGQRAMPNPFQDPKPSAVQEALLERQIEEKVAAKLREISKGTILSPLLKSRTMGGGELDLKGLKKAIKKPSPLAHVKREKTAKEEQDIKLATEHMTGLFNMFPTVEPDLLHILNHGTAKQLKGLKECGQSRAELIISARPPAGFTSVLDLMHKDILSCKILNRLVYANSMEADTLAALAHSVVVHKQT